MEINFLRKNQGTICHNIINGKNKTILLCIEDNHWEPLIQRRDGQDKIKNILTDKEGRYFDTNFDVDKILQELKSEQTKPQRNEIDNKPNHSKELCKTIGEFVSNLIHTKKLRIISGMLISLGIAALAVCFPPVAALVGIGTIFSALTAVVGLAVVSVFSVLVEKANSKLKNDRSSIVQEVIENDIRGGLEDNDINRRVVKSLFDTVEEIKNKNEQVIPRQDNQILEVKK